VKTVTFTVYGRPLPKGSAKAFVIKGTNRAVVTSNTKGLKGWEESIRAEAQQHATELMLGSIGLDLVFSLPRPKSLKVGKPARHTKRPDLDKLIRGACDALNGIIWKDDAQITAILARKVYAPTQESVPYVRFQITEESL